MWGISPFNTEQDNNLKIIFFKMKAKTYDFEVYFDRFYRVDMHL